MPLSAKQLAAIQEASNQVLAEATDFLQQLVRVDTTNPPGLNYRTIAELIRHHLDALGYDQTDLLVVPTADLSALAPHDPAQHERVNVLGRLRSRSATPNVVTTPRGRRREKTLHFDGHTDVVPAGDLSTWSHEPFGGEVVDGTIYGRGVSDMKGGLAAQVYAVEAVKRAGLVLRGTVEQSGVVDEESTGVRNAGAGWLVEEDLVSPETVDAVVITEPLNVENVCLGHRGALWGTITFHGVASHGAIPQRGVNALVHASRFVTAAMDQIQTMLATKFEPRTIPPEARGASLTFTVIEAGKNHNSVPDRAVLKYDRRLVPGETLAEARTQIQTVLDELQSTVPELRYTLHENYHTEPVWVDEKLEVCRVWKEAIERVIGQRAGVVCSPGSDDQRFFVRGGIEQCIVYGPGNITNVHNKDEALPLEDLRKSIEVMAVGLAEFLGVD